MRPLRIGTTCFATAVCATIGLAQEPLFRLSVAGPEAVRQAILPTNVGSLLSDRDTEFVANLLRGRLQGLMRARAPGDDDIGEAIERRVLGYRGRIEAEVWVSRVGDEGEIDFDGQLLLWHDGETDLVGLCSELEAWTRDAAEDALRTIECEGRAYSVVDTPDFGVSLPIMRGEDHAVLFFGSDPGTAIPRGVRRLEQDAPRYRARHVGHRPSDLLTIEVDLEQVVALGESELDRDSDNGALVTRTLGIDTYRDLRTSVGTNGPHLQFEIAVTFGPGHRGIFDAFLPSIETLPRMLDSMPLSGERDQAFACGHVRWRELWEVALDVAANFRFFRSETRGRDEIRDDANREAGFDIEDDLLASVGTEVALVYELGVRADAQDLDDPDADGLCVVFEIRDDQAFAKVFEKLRGEPIRIDERLEHAGKPLYSGRFLDRGEHFAHVPGRFLYAIGPRGRTALERVLGRPADAVGAPPASLRSVRRSAPPGWNFAASVPAAFAGDTLFEEIAWELWKELRSTIPLGNERFERQDLATTLGKVLPALAEHRLDRIAILGGFANSEARLRLIW